MKYLKEGRWEDFNLELINNINRLADMNKELLDDIADCMVDLEDYQIKYGILTPPGNNIIGGCYYRHNNISSDNSDLIINLCDKLYEYIGQGWDFYWSHKGKTNNSGFKNFIMQLDYLKNTNKVVEFELSFIFHEISEKRMREMNYEPYRGR